MAMNETRSHQFAEFDEFADGVPSDPAGFERLPGLSDDQDYNQVKEQMERPQMEKGWVDTVSGIPDPSVNVVGTHTRIPETFQTFDLLKWSMLIGLGVIGILYVFFLMRKSFKLSS